MDSESTDSAGKQMSRGNVLKAFIGRSLKRKGSSADGIDSNSARSEGIPKYTSVL